MISIVMAYHNRPDQLYTTLKSIIKSKSAKEVEIIIVDDASDVKPKGLKDFDLNIRLFRIKKEDKWWVNPCIPYNYGFKRATGDYIIIQNPECVHVGDLITYVKEHQERDTYHSFHCYSINVEMTHKVWEDLNEIKNIKFRDAQPNDTNIDEGWYNHEIYRPSYIHFCAAISKYRLDEIGGFDPRFAKGIAKEDIAFVHTLQHHKEIKMKFVANPFVIHQYHKRSWKGAGHPNIVMFREIQFETVHRELEEEYFEKFNVKSIDDLGSKTKSEFEGELKRRKAFIK